MGSTTLVAAAAVLAADGAALRWELGPERSGAGGLKIAAAPPTPPPLAFVREDGAAADCGRTPEMP